MQRWVDETIDKHQIEQVFIFSSAMAQFVDKPIYNKLHRVIDFVDVDSDKWRQYAESHQGLMKWVYQREHQKLQQAEQKYCERFAHSLFVSPDEALLFRNLMPQALSNKVGHLLNGVDVDFFEPVQAASITETEVPLNRRYLVFTGAMDYWANVDAVRWFADEVWPGLLAKTPDLHFIIAGGNPTAEVKELGKRTNIVVTGRVKDVRPYIAQALFVVAPLRIARGIQNKVLEAMSLNKVVVATDMAMEGINAPQSAWLRQTDAAESFTAYCLDLLEHPVAECGARQWVIDHFTWQATLAPLRALATKA
jgi:sugar transferase (PEP-CTERM/EpsH1 system associated)